MLDSEKYEEYLLLKMERKVHDDELRDIENQQLAVQKNIDHIDKKLRNYSEYQDIDYEKAKRLMSSLVFETLKKPAIFDEGGSTASAISRYKSDPNGYETLSTYQKEQFSILEPMLKKRQLSMYHALSTAKEVLPEYDMNTCDGFHNWCCEIIRNHPDYQDLSASQIKEIKEIIYNFANYTTE